MRVAKNNRRRRNQRGLSSAGRAPALHAGGQEFDPPRLHHYNVLKEYKLKEIFNNLGYRNNQENKRKRWMPWQSEATKDVVACEKLWRAGK